MSSVVNRHEHRVLKSGGFQSVFGSQSYPEKLGEPTERTPQWCTETIRLLIDAEYWAPVEDWVPEDPTALHFKNLDNARWVLGIAEVAGFEASLSAGPVGPRNTHRVSISIST